MDLHTAAKTGDLQRMLTLIGMQTQLDTRDKLSRTPLHLAAWAGQVVSVVCCWCSACLCRCLPCSSATVCSMS